MATLNKIISTQVTGVGSVTPGENLNSPPIQAPLVAPDTTRMVISEAQKAGTTVGENVQVGLLARQRPGGTGKRQKAFPLKPVTFEAGALRTLATGLGPIGRELSRLFSSDPNAFHTQVRLAFAGGAA